MQWIEKITLKSTNKILVMQWIDIAKLNSILRLMLRRSLSSTEENTLRVHLKQTSYLQVLSTSINEKIV